MCKAGIGSQTSSQRKQHIMQFIEDKAGFSILKIFLHFYPPSVPWLCPTNHRQYKALNFKTAIFSYLDATCPINSLSLSFSDTACSFSTEMDHRGHYLDSGLSMHPRYWRAFRVFTEYFTKHLAQTSVLMRWPRCLGELETFGLLKPRS